MYKMNIYIHIYELTLKKNEIGNFVSTIPFLAHFLRPKYMPKSTSKDISYTGFPLHKTPEAFMFT